MSNIRFYCYAFPKGGAKLNHYIKILNKSQWDDTIYVEYDNTHIILFANYCGALTNVRISKKLWISKQAVDVHIRA